MIDASLHGATDSVPPTPSNDDSSPQPAHPLEHLWQLMSGQFLDADERGWLVVIAHTCIEEGLSVDAARDVWRYDVSRAVWQNLINPAGAWAGFEPTWFLERVLRLRARWDNQPGTGRRLRYWMRSFVVHDRAWQVIERFMRVLLAEENPDDRRRLYEDYCVLSAHYFDDRGVLCRVPDARPLRGRLEALYERSFRPLVVPATLSSKNEPYEPRIRALLETLPES